MALAILEGVAFDATIHMEAYRRKDFPCWHLQFVGGASSSDLWTNILRHVPGLPLTRFRQTDAAGVGAAAFAAFACGIFPTINQAAYTFTRGTASLMPPADGSRYYRGKYGAYKALLPSVEALYDTLIASPAHRSAHLQNTQKVCKFALQRHFTEFCFFNN